MINEFARICKKHNLKWFAYAGTLLGAARHNGFIPWDDDVDLAMLRPDYDKFIQIAPTELDSNYFLDNWIDYRLEEEAAFDDNTDENLQFLSTEVTNTIRSKNWFWPTRAGYVKLRDSNTIQLNWASRKNVNQGIWIDIFPLDFVPPFADEKKQRNFDIATELFLAVSHRQKIIDGLNNKKSFVTPLDQLKKFLDMPFHLRARNFEKHMADLYTELQNTESQYVGWLLLFLRRKRIFKVASFDKTIDLPFELATISCPAEYDDVLTSWYGNWREPVFKKGHSRIWSDTMSYKDYFAQVTR